MTSTTVKNLHTKRILTYWLAVGLGYIFPFTYFFVKPYVAQTSEVNQTSATWVMPVLVAGIFLVTRLTVDLMKWTRTWRPSFWKGILLALPKLFLFGILVSIGLLLEWLVSLEVDTSFYTYFETVFVLFGGQAAGAVIGAFHLKYYQLDLIDKGYVLGVINR